MRIVGGEFYDIVDVVLEQLRQNLSARVVAADIYKVVEQDGPIKITKKRERHSTTYACEPCCPALGASVAWEGDACSF